MAQVNVNDLKQGMKLEIDKQPYLVVSLQFVKPGKGQAFTRTKIKNLLTNRVIEKSYRSGEKLEQADVEESVMRMLYQDVENVVFMDDKSFEQINVPLTQIEGMQQWLMEDHLYSIIFYNKEPISIDPPTFMDMEITETDPGVRGDTASGRVLKPAVTESGAKVQIPIFIEQGERIKIDTRTGEYVSRSN
ncbi:MAG: Elongation factor P [Chlamydiae bacterium]|nr:Elongation factor P [Chlamydiota bacterium]